MEGLIENVYMMNSVPATALIQLADRAVQRRRCLTALIRRTAAVCTADHQLLHHCFTVVFGLEVLLTKITVITISRATIDASKTPSTATTKTNRATPTMITEASQGNMILA